MTIKFINRTLSVLPLVMLINTTTLFAADGKALYESKGCIGCHGADAKSPIAPAYPKLAGQTKEYTIQQLKDFKSGARSNGQAATMKGIMATVNDDEITTISEYLSELE